MDCGRYHFAALCQLVIDFETDLSIVVHLALAIKVYRTDILTMSTALHFNHFTSYKNNFARKKQTKNFSKN